MQLLREIAIPFICIKLHLQYRDDFDLAYKVSKISY
jgi:hypothetical protein